MVIFGASETFTNRPKIVVVGGDGAQNLKHKSPVERDLIKKVLIKG